MKVLVLSNGQFEEKEINNTLEALQEEVNGHIEIPFLSRKLAEKEIDMIINEEGKMIDGMNMEIAVVHDGELVDIVFGNVLFTSHDEEGGTIGLNEEQIAFIKEQLENTAGLIRKSDRKPIVLRALFI